MGSNFIVPGAFGLPTDPLHRKILEADPVSRKFGFLKDEKRPATPPPRVLTVPPETQEASSRRRRATILTGGAGRELI